MPYAATWTSQRVRQLVALEIWIFKPIFTKMFANHFKEKTIVITAAAGHVGKCLVKNFLSAGGNVIAVDKNELGLTELKKHYPDIIILNLDVGNRATADEIIIAANGEIDVLCNNAALIEATVIEDIEEDIWDEIIRVNLTGPFLLSRKIVPLMVRRGGGVIINTGSTASLRGGRCGPAYTASKHGLLGLTQNIASTYFEKGVRCNIVCPGHIERKQGDPEISVLQASPLFVARPWSKSSSAEGIASLILFLASDAAKHINGVAIPIDEGSLAF